MQFYFNSGLPILRTVSSDFIELMNNFQHGIAMNEDYFSYKNFISTNMETTRKIHDACLMLANYDLDMMYYPNLDADFNIKTIKLWWFKKCLQPGVQLSEYFGSHDELIATIAVTHGPNDEDYIGVLAKY